MLIVVASHRFLKESKLAQKRGCDLAKLDAVIALLTDQQELPGYRDCHIEPNWLLIYKADQKRLYLARTGTHSDLFSK